MLLAVAAPVARTSNTMTSLPHPAGCRICCIGLANCFAL